MKHQRQAIKDLFGQSGLFLCLWALISTSVCLVPANAVPHSQISDQSPFDPSLQFTSGGHVLSFGPELIVVAGPDHLLTLSFEDAQRVAPQTTGWEATDRPGHLTSVTYPNLWPGVSLQFEGRRGLMESIYHVRPTAKIQAIADRQRPVDQIRLRYNVPVSLDKTGNLILAMDTGHMRESAPIAWQEINGRKVPVQVAFKILGQYQVGFDVAAYDPAYPLMIDPVMTWNTFLGAEAHGDNSRGIALDDAGNVYVSGSSRISWGAPVNPHQGRLDAFVAKLDTDGNLIWHTFIGSATDDEGTAVALDNRGNLFVTGYGNAAWGTPVAEHNGRTDAFVARLNSSDGALVWHTFMGSSDRDYSYHVLTDSDGNLFVAGHSENGWGAPIQRHAGAMEVFVAQLSATNGNRLWHTFMGSSGDDFGNGLARDGEGNLYVGGRSDSVWGSPQNGHTASGDFDVFIAKLSPSGNRLWHTFMGSPGYDYSAAVAVDDDHLYLAGYSNATWGEPINAHAGDNDAFVAKVDPKDGRLAWHTFMGSVQNDQSSDAVLDAGGDILVLGFSQATWGSPATAHAGSADGFAAKLSADGHRLWNTFMGSAAYDLSNTITIDAKDNAFICGSSQTNWGAPVNGHSGTFKDVFVAKLGATYKLSVILNGIGIGTVTAVPAGVDCGGNCIAAYDQGSLVTLSATPDAVSTFSGWAGIGCAETGDCTVSMTADRIIRAHFNNPALDTDGDGIQDTDERGPSGNDTSYDGNADRVADWRQAEVVSSPSADGQGYVTFSTAGQAAISAANTFEKPPWTDLPDEVAFDLGFFDFTVDNRMVGDTLSITFRFNNRAIPLTYYKFGPTPDNPVDHWYEFLYDGSTGAQIDGNVVTLHFKDGQRGDSDLDDTNGIIADPGGPGFTYGGGGDGDDDDGVCLIRTIMR